MIIAECVDRKYKGKKIIAYLLRNEKGEQVEVDANKLKIALSRGLIQITNLSLTSDGRILLKEPVKNTNNNDIVILTAGGKPLATLISGKLIMGVKENRVGKVREITDEECSYALSMALKRQKDKKKKS